jgi:hypothetical protein
MLICREPVVQLHGEFRIPTLLKQLTAFAVAKSRLAAISRNEMVHFHVSRSLETSKRLSLRPKPVVAWSRPGRFSNHDVDDFMGWRDLNVLEVH